VDYVTKPIQREELLARIQHHLQLNRLQKELTAKTQDLAQKNAELEAYAHTIAHSLKTPLAAAGRFLEILCKFKSDDLSGEQRHLAQQAQNALAMIGEVVDALLLLSTVAQQHVELKPLDTGSLVSQALSQLGEMLARQRADVKLPQTWPQALGYAPWVGEVWLNLLSNALKYGGSPPRLEVAGAPDGPHVRFSVRDNGQPLSDDERQRFLRHSLACTRSGPRVTALVWPRCSASCRSSEARWVSPSDRQWATSSSSRCRRCRHARRTENPDRGPAFDRSASASPHFRRTER
jgi:signal transduction histidine kinase